MTIVPIKTSMLDSILCPSFPDNDSPIEIFISLPMSNNSSNSNPVATTSTGTPRTGISPKMALQRAVDRYKTLNAVTNEPAHYEKPKPVLKDGQTLWNTTCSITFSNGVQILHKGGDCSKKHLAEDSAAEHVTQDIINRNIRGKDMISARK